MIDTTVSFEHNVEMTIPNSIYSEQGEKIHKPSLMVPKCEHPPDISDLVFKPRLERVSDPKTTVKIIWKAITYYVELLHQN